VSTEDASEPDSGALPIVMTPAQEATVRHWLARREAGAEASLMLSVLLPRFTDKQYLAVFVDDEDEWKILSIDQAS